MFLFKKNSKKILVLVMSFLLLSCGEKNYNGQAIYDFGIYNLDHGNRLEAINDKGLVVYKLFNGKDEELVIHKSRASVYQRWVLIFKNEKLWFASSDVGNVVWMKNFNGLYIQHNLHQIEFELKKIPLSIKNFL